MPDGKQHFQDSGKTVIDVLVACAALALVGCLALPALSKERDDARIAQCADHLKQLGQAAHQYAADFEGKFFYNRSRKGDHNRQYKPVLAGRWFDKERVGRYLDGKPMFLAWKPQTHPNLPEAIPENPPPDWPQLGLGGGVFVCPSDGDSAGRSYEMNYWAGTGYSLHPDEKIPWTNGELFDSTSPKLDRLLLFTDVLGLTHTARGWVTNFHLGNQMLPGQRFGGIDMPPWQDLSGRFNSGQAVRYSTHLDYVRHGGNQDRSVPLGAVNIGYADGHVGLRQHNQLYDADTRLSTYNTLWSLIDRQVESGQRHAN